MRSAAKHAKASALEDETAGPCNCSAKEPGRSVRCTNQLRCSVHQPAVRRLHPPVRQATLTQWQNEADGHTAQTHLCKHSQVLGAGFGYVPEAHQQATGLAKAPQGSVRGATMKEYRET
eukprot:3504039-Alexandrium_andersonii.AAC.1